MLGRTEIIFSFDSAVIVARFLAETEEWATIGANSLTDAYAALVREQARVPFDESIRVLDDEVARLEADLIGVQQEIRQAIDTPRRTELDDQLVRAIDRTVRLQNELALAGTEDEKAPIRTELADVTRQINLMLDLISLEASSPGVAGLNVRQSGLIGQIEDMSERRNRLAVDTQLLSSGVVLKTEAFVGTPVDTATGRLLLVGGFLGGLIGAGVAYLLALRRRVIIDRNAAELILAAPLIAAVPNFRQEGISSTLPVRAAPRSASAEAFRFAATALDLSRTAPSGTTLTEGKVVAITSAGIEDGKTVVAANTALAAAREGKRVLLIDADFTSQVAAKLLAPDVLAESGITEVVESGIPLSEAVIPVEGSGATGLHLLARGKRDTAPPEFFRSPGTKDFLVQVQDYYDLVLIDAPSLLEVAYVSTLVGMVDKVLIVVAHDSSVLDVEELQDRLDLIGTPTAGYVYNFAPLRTEFSRGDSL